MKQRSVFVIALIITMLAATGPATSAPQTAERGTKSSGATAVDPGASYTAIGGTYDESGSGGGSMGNPDYPSPFTDIGNHCDDCTTQVNFPFPVEFYGETYNSAYVSSNGNLQFTGNNASYANSCLPDPNFGATIFAFGTDLRTHATGDQISTGTFGSAPFRIFAIKWSVHKFVSTTEQAVFTLWFREGQSRIDVGHLTSWNNGATAVLGVQASGTGPFTQFSCNAATQGSRTLVKYTATRPLTVNKTGSGAGSVTSQFPGINCGDDCSETYNKGTTVTLTAQAQSGSAFTGWSGGGCSGTGSCSVKLDSSTTVSATFLVGRALTVAKSGSGAGTVTSSPAGIDCGVTCEGAFTDGDSVTLTAVADPNSLFVGWTSGCEGTADCVLLMDQDRSATATFDLQTCPGLEDDIRPQLVGTAGDDVLVGSTGADIICGLGGNDEIRGKGGGDLILGAAGLDDLIGGGGGDIEKGGGGNDLMSGGDGRDKLKGGVGKDAASGGKGRDLCRAEIKKGCEA
ncbi:MAG: large repetitive protein [Actinomycetota bacterium]|nr:large repetitive protein [Actinomycetota bacterium]